MQYEIFNIHSYKLSPKILNNFSCIANFVADYFKLDPKTTFDLNLVSDEEIKLINYKYRNKNYPTDVLSFPFSETPVSLNLLGEIYITYPYIKEQAKFFNVTFESEISFLFLHGLLHLLGYTHDTEETKKEMFDLQNKILKELNIITE